MKIVVMVMAMVIMSVTMVQAIETCYPPVVTCPKVEVECRYPDIKECPTLEAVCQCSCEVGMIELPGLWRLGINGRTSCGVIEVMGSGFILTDARDGKGTFFLINYLKKAKQVESCE